MKNGIEIRKHGLQITKKKDNVIFMYYVSGSKNGPWDFLHNARKDADTQLDVEAVIEAVENGATHWDNVMKQWLKVQNDTLSWWDAATCLGGGGGWVRSNHKRGVDMVTEGDCINLEVYLNSDHNHFLSPGA